MKPGDVISYIEMCQQEGQNLQRGMNFRSHGNTSVILMSLRRSAPYADRIEDGGKTLIYEGHDVAASTGLAPKLTDQPMYNPAGTFTQNGKFYDATIKHKKENSAAEIVRVYEKLHPGIWVYNGLFRLVDAWQEISGQRKVFKFRLELTAADMTLTSGTTDMEHNRVVPSWVKLEVWKRDKGQCAICGKKDNLHFDHDLPFSKGGASITPENVRILCARHNLSKGAKIQ